MKYPYASPNLRFVDLLHSLLMPSQKAKQSLLEYFSQLSGKKYLLITNSCRTALYLAYKALGKNGRVITSPLSCKAAIDPIVESGNTPYFADIQLEDLNINPNDIYQHIFPNTIAIQAIHFGGVSCEMEKILNIAKSNNLPVIEDCAQSLGASYKNKPVGSLGDIACFSLIKNAYGIGGGIFATNSLMYYEQAKEIQEYFTQQSEKIILYRIVRNLIDTKRKYRLGRFLYELFIFLKGRKSNYSNVKNQLFKPSLMEVKIAGYQVKRYQHLHNQRCKIGKQYYTKLLNTGLLVNNKYDTGQSSFTKFYLYNPCIRTKSLLPELYQAGIEAMHLEQKHGSPYQNKIPSNEFENSHDLINFNIVHDSIISLPLSENLKEEDVNKIVDIISSTINKS